MPADRQQLLLQEETGCKQHRWVETWSLGMEKKKKKSIQADRTAEPTRPIIPAHSWWSLSGGGHRLRGINTHTPHTQRENGVCALGCCWVGWVCWEKVEVDVYLEQTELRLYDSQILYELNIRHEDKRGQRSAGQRPNYCTTGCLCP